MANGTGNDLCHLVPDPIRGAHTCDGGVWPSTANGHGVLGTRLGGVVLGTVQTANPTAPSVAEAKEAKLRRRKGREILKTPSELVLDESNYHQIPSQKHYHPPNTTATTTTTMSAETDTLKLSYAYGTSPLTPTSLTEPLKTYLFGYPIAHSLAPLLHNTLFSALNTNWNYSLVESTNFDDFLPKLKASNCIGSAVTMPHKVNFISQVDDLTEEGRMIGAINTVFIRLDATGNKRYIGTNTDCIGIREAFLQNYPEILSRSAGKPAMILGGGGACRSAIYACWKWLGASQIYLVNRIPEEVTAIIDAFREARCPANIIHVATLEQAKELETPVVVVGTVPDFAPKEPGEILARKIVEEFLQRDVERAEGAPKGYVNEMCYHPHPVTAFYKLSENYGWSVIPGTEPMMHQGIAQQVLWAEKQLEEFPVDHAKDVIREALEKARQGKH